MPYQHTPTREAETNDKMTEAKIAKTWGQHGATGTLILC